MQVVFGALVFLFGTLIGSFVNVVLLRHGFKEAARSRSGCAACGVQLPWYTLVPLLSYGILRGRCHACGSHVALHYPLVELLVGTLFTATFFLVPLVVPLSFVMFGALCVFWAVFVALTVYDLKHTLVPFPFAVILIVSALFVRIAEALLLMQYAPLIDALFGVVIFAGFMLLLFLITRGKGMGLGDVYVAAALGVLFGVAQSLETLVLSFWIGAGVGIALLALKRRYTIKSEVPFVPFLFVAAVIELFTTFSPLGVITTLF